MTATLPPAERPTLAPNGDGRPHDAHWQPVSFCARCSHGLAAPGCATRVKTQGRPLPLSSRGAPTRAMFPSADRAILKPKYPFPDSPAATIRLPL
jgi:hypothetical protein